MGDGGGVEELAAAVEVVHAYSLVHDDLPCMDDDDLRRGRPTTHRAFDVPTATRAGFHMVALAARVLAEGMERLALSRNRRRDIAAELFRAAGAGGMIGGQWLDLEAEGRGIPRSALEEVHARKTGALIAASCVIGGLAAGDGGPGAYLEALRGYGRSIGLAFQIADDVLDATATSDQLGKTAGKDAARAKSTFVTLLGVGAARAEAERCELGQRRAGTRREHLPAARHQGPAEPEVVGDVDPVQVGRGRDRVGTEHVDSGSVEPLHRPRVEEHRVLDDRVDVAVVLPRSGGGPHLDPTDALLRRESVGIYVEPLEAPGFAGPRAVEAVPR